MKMVKQPKIIEKKACIEELDGTSDNYKDIRTSKEPRFSN